MSRLKSHLEQFWEEEAFQEGLAAYKANARMESPYQKEDRRYILWWWGYYFHWKW